MDLQLEKTCFQDGCELIGAVDEVGRGPLAGPVVSACVLIDKNFVLTPELLKVKDSKKLSSRQRESLFPIIKRSVRAVAIGVCDHKIIDRYNILQATFLSMKKAIKKTGLRPDIVLVDGRFPIPKLDLKQKAIINGDELVFSIAMASIIAKVSRDFMMAEFHKKYPAYSFNQHKGYGTKLHRQMIELYGPCPIHRLSFAPFNSKPT